jgi:hypothetical protein
LARARASTYDDANEAVEVEGLALVAWSTVIGTDQLNPTNKKKATFLRTPPRFCVAPKGAAKPNYSVSLSLKNADEPLMEHSERVAASSP